MYGDAAHRGVHTPLEGELVIDPIPARIGQILKAALEDRLNPEGLHSATPRYRLHLTLRKSLVPTVVESNGTIQRYDVRFDSDFQLYERDKKIPVFTGSLHRTGSYNSAPNANFATYEAQQDTIERTLQEVAEDYVLRLSGYFASQKP
jgi:hypothetical protein